jgi:decaprenylphospho-beta-D-ribofuranose 2-oxidase
MRRILEFDPRACTVTLEAGMTLGELMGAVVPHGWLPAVLPGTRFVTVGGAIAADVHGRNHHFAGSFGAYVISLRLRTPGETLTVSPHTLPELFWATVGGMGLTGVIVQATLRLRRIDTPLIRVLTQRVEDLDAAMALMSSNDSPYCAAWIDCLARGRGLGRGVVVWGDHATREEVRDLDGLGGLTFSTARQLRAPRRYVPSLARHGARMMNRVVYRRAPATPGERLQTLQQFFHTHDRIDLFSLFAPSGFLEYQFVVPFDRAEVIRAVIERIAEAQIEPFFAVLKRFGERNPAPLSFPIPGWMAAFDFAFTPAVWPLFGALDALIADAGGRIFLAKDACVRPELLPVMYPQLDAWRTIRGQYDPDAIMRSDLAERLSLLGPAPPVGGPFRGTAPG